MTEAVEFLLSEEVKSQINKPYLTMSKEEKAQLEKFKDMYWDLSDSEIQYIKTHSDVFSFAKLDTFNLERSLNDIVDDIYTYLSADGRFLGDFENLKEFCLVNNINFDEFFGNLYEELEDVIVRRGNGEYIPLYEVESFRKCVDKFFALVGEEARVKNGENLLGKETFNEIDANLLKLSGIDLDDIYLTEQQRLTFLLGTSNNAIVKFLQSKPEKLNYNGIREPIKGALFDYLNDAQIVELFDALNDDEYETRLILSGNITGISHVSHLFPRLDRYMQTQIVCTQHENSVQSVELAEEKIKHYTEVRSALLALPKEERATFLSNLENVETKEPEGVGSYRDNNEIKKSLLEYLETQEERDLVVESLQRFVDPRLEFYVETAEMMIEEFFENHGELSKEEKEYMKSALKSMDFLVEHYEKDSTRGRTYHLTHYTSISGDYLSNPNMTMFYVLHEMTHAMSMANFRQTGHNCGLTFEEGMADTFAKLALSEYIEKHGEIDKDGINISIENVTSVVGATGYKFENGWLRSMLYVLQQQGLDYEGIRRFLLGDKANFFEMVMGHDFCESLNLDFNGEPANVGFTYREFYDANSQYLQNIDRTSSYYDMNFILPAFVIQDRFGDKQGFDSPMIEILQSKRYKNKNFINNIFDRRKLYEVSYEEYAEFSQLYNQANLAKKRYIGEKVEYIKSKYSELEEEEIEEHGMEIVGALAGLLQGSKEDFDIDTERKLNKLLLKAIRAAKIQARVPERAQEASKLYENLHSMDRKSFKKESLEVILEALEGFYEDLGEYAERSQKKTFATQLVGAIQHEEISLDEVREAGMAIVKDRLQSKAK